MWGEEAVPTCTVTGALGFPPGLAQISGCSDHSSHHVACETYSWVAGCMKGADRALPGLTMAPWIRPE